MSSKQVFTTTVLSEDDAPDALSKFITRFHAHAPKLIVLTTSFALRAHHQTLQHLSGAELTTGTPIPIPITTTTSDSNTLPFPASITPATTVKLAALTSLAATFAALAHHSGRWDGKPRFAGLLNGVAVANSVSVVVAAWTLTRWGRVRAFGQPLGGGGGDVLVGPGPGPGPGDGVSEGPVTEEHAGVLAKAANVWALGMGANLVAAGLLLFLFTAHLLKPSIDRDQHRREKRAERRASLVHRRGGDESGCEDGPESEH